MGVERKPLSTEHNLSHKMNTSDHRSPILIQERSVYGRSNYYVVSEHKAAIHRLTGKSTVDSSDVSALTMLGFDVRMEAKVSMPACEAVLR